MKLGISSMSEGVKRWGIVLVAAIATMPQGGAHEVPATSVSAPVTLSVSGRASANVSLAADGAFVATVWAASEPGEPTDIFAATSRDGGVSFSPPARVNSTPGEARVSGEQPPRVALVRRQLGAPEMVVVWTTKSETGTVLLTARSDDFGATFSRSTVVGGSDAAGNRGWEAVATVGIQTIWLDHRAMAKREGHTPHAGHHAGHDPSSSKMDGAAMAQLSALYAGSLDKGAEGRPIARGVCYCCKTALATRSDGAIFAAWRHVYQGNIRDIAFTVSRDGGRTFASPIRVSEDNWILDGCPDDGPTLAVDEAGTVHVVWPTLVAEPEPHVMLMYASTRDGRQFTPRMSIATLGSLKPSHPQAVVSGGQLVAVWDEVVEAKRRIAVSRAAIGRSSVSFTTPTTISDAESSVYPVAAAVPGGVLIAWTSGSPDASAIVVRRITTASGTE